MGIHKNIESPEVLADYFNKYMKWVSENPILIEDYVGKDADRVLRQKPRPYTLEGFNVWLSRNNIIANLWDYYNNKENRYNDFAIVCSHIKESVRANQIEGGMAGIYNPSITQRLNGLTEKSEVKLDATIQDTTIKWGNHEIKV